MVLSGRICKYSIAAQGQKQVQYRVTFDSATDNCFRVHTDNGRILKFQEASKTLYYFDTSDHEVEKTILITAVDDNKSKLSAHAFSRAK